ncbi:MAG: tetratricopeptide repeat protein, partial [Thaumarchaeota archaeon]|nr:tetratricopeptide repeat protein [Nitrososphaerota archaeon]
MAGGDGAAQAGDGPAGEGPRAYGPSPEEARLALEAIDAELATDGGNADLHLRRAHALCWVSQTGGGAGDLEEAVAACDRAAELGAGDAAACSQRGMALGIMGRNEEAIESFARAIRADPDNVDNHIGMGAALGSLGRGEEAAESFARAARLDPKDAEIRVSLARA